MIDKLKNKIRAGYFFSAMDKKEPISALEIDLPKGFNIDAITTRKLEFGIGLTKDIGRKFSFGVATLTDGKKRRTGFLFSWKF